MVGAPCWLRAAAAPGLAAHPPAPPWALGGVAGSQAMDRRTAASESKPKRRFRRVPSTAASSGAIG
jgi:hypothetical protein